MIESGISSSPAPEVPLETDKTDDNAPSLPPTPVDGSPSRDGLKHSDTESNDDTEARAEELTATALPDDSSPTIPSAEPSSSHSSNPATTPVPEPAIEHTESQSAPTTALPPVVSAPASSPGVKSQEEDHTSTESKDERSAEAHSVADSISSTMTDVATTAGTVEDKRSPTASGTTGTTPSSPPKADPTPIVETKLAVDATPPDTHPKPPASIAPSKNETNGVVATSTQDQKVAAVLDINAELLK